MLILERTEKAMELYDIANDKLLEMIDTGDTETIERELKIVEEYGRLVGLAYGCDTAAINNIDDCEKLVRPGVKYPVNPDDLSFVRKMLKLWKEQCK